jgi:hypothetical protein
MCSTNATTSLPGLSTGKSEDDTMPKGTWPPEQRPLEITMQNLGREAVTDQHCTDSLPGLLPLLLHSFKVAHQKNKQVHPLFSLEGG